MRELKVDCAKGESISKALTTSEPGPILIHVLGECREDVIIDRDRVTLRGEAGSAILGALSTDEPQPTILLSGFRGMTIEDLTVGAVDSRGIQMRDSSSATLTRVRVTGSDNTGLSVLDNSSVRVEDGVFEDNLFGIFASGGSSIRFHGHNRANGNFAGIVFDDGSVGNVGNPQVTLEVSHNAVGISVQQASWLDLSSVVAHDNEDALLVLEAGASIRRADFLGNTGWGGVVQAGHLDVGEGRISGGYVGLEAELESTIHLGSWGPVQITENEYDIVVDDSSATMFRTTAAWVELSFASRASIWMGSAIGSIVCDYTVITRGIQSCSRRLEEGADEVEGVKRFPDLSTPRAALRETDPAPAGNRRQLDAVSSRSQTGSVRQVRPGP